MVKKIINVPEGTAYFVAKDATAKSINNAPVSLLKDAPDKRVIELPADVIEHVKWAKEYDDSKVIGFLQRLEIDEFEELRPLYPDDLADWYLHPELVELVPKKEPEFVVMLPVGQWYRLEPAYYMRDDKGLNNFIAIIDLASRMSEEEADELVGGLEAFNARKVKVED